jgi:Ca-activated chloride channel family protein
MEPVGEGVIGDTDQVPDASRITPPILLPGFPNPVRLELEVEIDLAGLPIDNLSSSLHSILTEEDGNTLRIRLNPGERLSRDFILRYSIADHQLGARAIVAPDSEGARQGTLAVILTAPRADRSTAKPCGICARPIWQHERLEDRGGQARAGQID